MQRDEHTIMGDLTESALNVPPDQRAIRAKCFHPTGTFVPFERGEIEQSIPERFESIARKYPQALAVKTKTDSLTYGELNNAANRLANAILSKRGNQSEPVALLFEQGVPAIVAILAILKAGKFYVPLDPFLPIDKSKDILLDSTAALLITNRNNASQAAILAAGGCQLIHIEDVESDAQIGNPELSTPSDAIAYLVYTSGSTGQPKAVIHNHRYVLYHGYEYSHSFHISTADRMSLVVPWNFSGGGFIIYSTLLNGASLFPIDLKAEGLESFARLLVDEQITIYHSTPTVFRHLLNILNLGDHLQNIRLIRLGGEPVTYADLMMYQRHFSRDCIMLNSLAATECGVISRYFLDKDTRLAEGNVPVGYAAKAKEILLLAEDGKAVGCNEIGEIAVRTQYLSSGYWRRPDSRARKFVRPASGGNEEIYMTGDLGRMTADGCLYHLGRKDLQMKIRGYRIEPAEVETALLEHDGIKEVAAVRRVDHAGDSRLIAYFVPAGKVAPAVSNLRKFLKQKLPDHMIPGTFVSLDTFPLTATGKIDRQSLPEPERSRPELENPFVAANTWTEKKLTSIWAEVLNLSRVGIHDNFFDLGGHSLAASRVVSHVIRDFQLELPLRSLFQSPTVAEMAAIIGEHQDKTLPAEEIEGILAEIESIREEEVQRLLSGNREQPAEEIQEPRREQYSNERKQ
jgi:amino acid adenylation domain-containing protein